MTIIATGNIHRIFSDDVKTYDRLPVGTYTVGFHPMQGFFLEKIKNIERPKGKIYGKHEKIAQRIVSAYEKKGSSLGAILSGKKGTGKTITASLISSIMKDKGIPTVVVDRNTKGIADFLSSIESPMFVFFDEFEKKFPNDRINNDGFDCTTQQDLLVLFDGVSKNNNMYVIATNSSDRSKLSEYLLGRPGRFHYHINYGEMDIDVVREYIKDNIDAESHVSEEELERAVKFCYRSNLSYDSISAICFELNMGSTLDEASSMLNIFDVLGKNMTFDISSITLSFTAGGDKTYTQSTEVYSIDFSNGIISTVDTQLCAEGDHRAMDFFSTSSDDDDEDDDCVIFDEIKFYPESILYHSDGKMEISPQGVRSLYMEGDVVEFDKKKISIPSIIIESPYKISSMSAAV